MSHSWHSPLPLRLVPTADSESFRQHDTGVTGLPLAPHPGAFGVERRHHTHEGVDLYCPTGTPVYAVEAGRVVRIYPFTGKDAFAPPSPWWHDTQAVLVEGPSGVVLYGELHPTVAEGDPLEAGQCLGHVLQVLRNDKGRPMSMLHLELHKPGTRMYAEWTAGGGRPATLEDPTPFLLASIPAL